MDLVFIFTVEICIVIIAEIKGYSGNYWWVTNSIILDKMHHEIHVINE